MASPDYVGIATLITASASAIGTLVALYRGRARDVKITEIKGLVDGLSDKRDAATAKSSYAEGRKDGGDQERAEPTGPLQPN